MIANLSVNKKTVFLKMKANSREQLVEYMH